MKSIYLRNFVATATMVSICFLLVAVSFVGIGRDYVIREYKDNMRVSAQEVARTAGAMADNDSLRSWNMSMLLSSVANSTGNHIFITDENAAIVCCSDRVPVCRHLGFQLDDETAAELKAVGLSRVTDLDSLYESKRFVVTAPIQPGGKQVLGYVFVSCDINSMLGAWPTFLGIASVVAMGVFVVALVVSMLYSKTMARPLDAIAAASRKFARGDFSVRVKQEEDTTDEMGALIDSFNKMADSLEQAENRRSEFIANISHELRTPMTTIAGFADGILDGIIPKEDEDKYLQSIRDETKRLSRLVRDMLDVSQLHAKSADPSRRTVFDLTELVLQTLLSFESRAKNKNLDVDPQLPDNHIMVRADKDAITQVIYNLLDNAVKFANAGSCITLRIYKDGGKACVSIQDCGETIPKEDLPFIFDRFHKSDRSRSVDKDGVGLGLYLVKTIINNHDEDIAVKSEGGVTNFVFTLPLEEPK